jgi:hypothetical protein
MYVVPVIVGLFVIVDGLVASLVEVAKVEVVLVEIVVAVMLVDEAEVVVVVSVSAVVEERVRNANRILQGL